MRVFVDTNVFVYAYDGNEPAKRVAAHRALVGHRADIVVSTQVIAEFYVVATAKLGLEAAAAHEAARHLAALPVVPVRAPMVMRAIDTSISNDISIWDAMIVEAAVEGGCSRLLTEDLNPGQVLRGVEIVDPFVGC